MSAAEQALITLAEMPSLWSLKLMFGGPTIEMSVAWGTGPGVVVTEFAGEDTNRAEAICKAIAKARAAVAVLQQQHESQR